MMRMNKMRIITPPIAKPQPGSPGYKGSKSDLSKRWEGGIKPVPNMANPATVYAKEQNLQIKLVTDAGGNQSRDVLVNGKWINQWTYFRNNYTVPEYKPKPKAPSLQIKPVKLPSPLPSWVKSPSWTKPRILRGNPYLKEEFLSKRKRRI